MSSSANSGYNAPTDFRIPQLPGNLDPNVASAFAQSFSAIQQIILTLVTNCGVGPRNVDQWLELAGNPITLLMGNLNRFYVQAAVDIPFGAAVALVQSGSIVTAELANATDATKPARGFCTTSGGILIGEVGEVQISTGIIEIAGLTPGSPYFLSTTDGLIAPTPAVAASNIEQYVGFALDEVNFAFNTGYWRLH